MNFFEAYSISNLLFLLNGLGLTLRLSISTIVISLVFGTIVAFIRYTRIPFLSLLFYVYVEAIRNLPPLLLLFIIYFGLPDIGINLPVLSAAIVALSIYGTSIMSEVVRGGFNSVEKGQIEAAQSQGLNYLQIVWVIILPQALKRMIPALVGESITLVKNTSYVLVLSLAELTRSGQIIYSSNVSFVFPIIILVALIYFIINYSLSIASQKIEKKLEI